MYFIIDGFNLAYRTGLVNEQLSNSRGVPSGMVYGFLRSLVALRGRFLSCKFIVAWDSRPDWKYELYPQYKDGRTASVGNFDGQLKALKAILYLLDVDQYKVPGQEADDIIASLCHRFRDKGLVYVLTNDKDMLGLVENGKVIVMKPKVGFSPEKFFDEEAVFEKFGVYPKNLIDYRSFDGDASDALPGVPRVPRKKIAALIHKYGTVDSIYSNISKENLTKFQKTSILGSEEQVKLNRKIMNLDRHLPDLGLSPGITAHRPVSETETEKIAKILEYYELNSIGPNDLTEFFWRGSNIKYSDPAPALELEVDDELFSDE